MRKKLFAQRSTLSSPGLLPGSAAVPLVMRAAWAILAAVLSALSQPNEIFLYGNWFLGLFCLAPLYMALVHTDRVREAALLGALFGSLNHALTSYWLFFYKDFAFWTLGSTTIAYTVVYAAAMMYGWLILKHAGRARPLVFAIAWAAFEFAKSTGFLGYPWGLLPYSFTAIPIMLQTADTWGVYGISAFLALCSASVGELILGLADAGALNARPLRRRPVQWVFASSIFGLVLLMYGFWIYQNPLPLRTTVRLLLCQQNTDPWVSGEGAALVSNISLARKALEQNAKANGPKPDLIVFSETSLQRPFTEFQSWFEKNPPAMPLLPFLRQANIPLLTGLPVITNWTTYEASNSVGLIYPSGNMGQTYAKMHPVPFAEAIPFWDVPWFRAFIQNVIGLESGWVMGTDPVVFSLDLENRGAVCTDIHTLPSIRFSSPICFEDAFAELCREFYLRGADLLINLTNDSWSRTRSAQIQHYAVARFRAIESRRTLVRSTNSGLSCVIGADGRTIAELPQFVAESAIVNVPVYAKNLTLYTLLGDWFAWLCSTFVGTMLIWSALREREIL